MPAPEHYFSESPGGELIPRTIHVRLAGRNLELTTANGVFSPERVDAGTSVLLSNVPAPPPGGNLLDLGCGWGPIALSLALESPRATVWAVDVNERSLDLVRRNAAKAGLTNIYAVRPEDVPTDALFTSIWSNPPIRVGKEVLHGMLRHWIPRLGGEVHTGSAAEAWLVVQKNLGSDSLQRWLEAEFPSFEVSRTTTSKSFRVLRVSPA